MSTTYDNQEKLLRQLSLQGDVTAFFTLSADYFEDRYLRERKNGTSHAEAQNRIITEAVSLLEDLQHIKPAQFDAWFDEHCTLLSSSTPEIDFEKENTAISADISTCLSHCSKALIKTGSEIARTVSRRNSRFPRNILQHLTAKILLGVVAAGLVFTLVTVLLIKFEASVRIMLVSPADSLAFQFPPPVAPDDIDSVYFLPAIPQDTVDTAASDTGGISRDSAVTPVRVKKKPLPKPAIVKRNNSPVTRSPKPVKTHKEPRVAPVPEPVTVPAPAPPPPPPSPPPAPLPPPASETNDIQPEPPQEVNPGNESVPTIPEPVETLSDEPDLM